MLELLSSPLGARCVMSPKVTCFGEIAEPGSDTAVFSLLEEASDGTLIMI